MEETEFTKTNHLKFSPGFKLNLMDWPRRSISIPNAHTNRILTSRFRCLASKLLPLTTEAQNGSSKILFPAPPSSIRGVKREQFHRLTRKNNETHPLSVPEKTVGHYLVEITWVGAYRRRPQRTTLLVFDKLLLYLMPFPLRLELR